MQILTLICRHLITYFKQLLWQRRLIYEIIFRKYFPDLNEFEHQYNDIWFNNMLNKLTEKGQLYVPILNKSFNKLGKKLKTQWHMTNNYLNI